MNKIKLIASFLLLATCAAQVPAYETLTHKTLTRNAVLRSVLATDPTLLSDMGMLPWDQAGYRNTNRDPFMTASEIIEFGSLWEDDDYSWRALNHFFDPQTNRPLGRALEVTVGPVVMSGIASPDWILEDRGDAIDSHAGNCVGGKGCPQKYSFKLGQQALYAMLTGITYEDRQTAASAALQMLGHVVHHVQDMAQPQHTRNDQHVHPDPIFGTYPIWSNYEMRTMDKNASIEKLLADLKASNTEYPVPKLFTARSFFHTANSSTARYVGMAEFTSNNYTSFGTQYRAQPGNAGGVLPSELPLPSGAGTRIARFPTPAATTVDGRPIPAGESDFLVGPIVDGYTGQTVEAKLAVPSLTYWHTAFGGAVVGGPVPVFVENSLIWEEQYKILMPRAAAFSAGMINHFFRGRLNMEKVANVSQWRITNSGKETMEGRFSIFAENGAGIRSPIDGVQTNTTVASGSSFTLSFSPPASTSKLIVVFTGRIGFEGDATLQSLFYAVAGKVIPYTAPAAPEITISRTPQPMVAGQAFSVTYTAKNIDSGSYACYSGGALASSGTLYAGTNTINGTASAGWTSSPLTCTYTLTGPGGQITRQESNLTTLSPALPCGSPFSAAGSSAGTYVTQELGSTPGNVWVSFFAYSIPDGLNITSNNGSKTFLTGTGGMVSGSKTLQFYHDPASRGSTQIKVAVTGNADPDTAWAVRVGCPGQPVPGESPVTVYFSLSGDSKPGDCNVQFSLYVDGVRRPFPGAVELLPSTMHSYTLLSENKSLSIYCTWSRYPTYTDGAGTHSMFTNSNQQFYVRGVTGYGGG